MTLRDMCVVVPARNEAAVIEATLRSLIAAGMRPGQIYLVDDCSQDETGAIGRSLGVIVFRNDPNLGKAHAIARVVDFFRLDKRFEFIALMDADTLVNEKYFAEMLKAFEDPNVVTACGRPKSRPCNWITAYRAYGYCSTHLMYRKAQSKIGVITVAPGCSTVYRSSIWRRLIWSKDTIVEDVDVTLQIHKKRLGRIIYVPEAVVYTQDPQLLSDYFKQMFRWNTGNWQAFRKHRLYRFRSKIDWECSVLYLEGMYSSLIYLLLPLLVIFKTKLIYFFLVDAGIMFAMALLASINERRKDIFLYSPFFPLMRFCDAWLFVKGFWKVIVRRQAVTVWFTPSRYTQEKPK